MGQFTMKSLSLLLAGLALANAASVHETAREWAEFKTTHSKTYETEEEEHSRFAIYRDNKIKIAEHNVRFEAGEISWEVGMNVFGDMTDAEFKSKMTGQAMPRSNRTEGGARVSCPYYSDTVHTPYSFDWRDHAGHLPPLDLWKVNITRQLENSSACLNKISWTVHRTGAATEVEDLTLL